MKLYYRISDNSYKKQKLIGATKEACFQNFIKAFCGIIYSNFSKFPHYVPKSEIPIKVILDNCVSETEDMVHVSGMPCEKTQLGNAGSLRYALEQAMEGDDNDIIYFCEDDYLHLDTAPKLIVEGMDRSDYVTLYDHPDKYTAQYNGGEFSKVIKTESSHWRYTISTCMTFATTVKTLKEDIDVWRKYTDGSHPHDHKIFTELSKEKRRRLAVCIPGAACHTDLEYSGRISRMTIEPWAIDMMIQRLESEIESKMEESFGETIKDSVDRLMLKFSMTGNKNGWSKLVALDAFRSTLVK